MRIVHLSTYVRGGAGTAALRLHRALKSHGVDSVFLSSQPDPEVRVLARMPASRWKQWGAKKPIAASRHFSANLFPTRLARQVQNYKPDLVHLHWVGDGFVPIDAVAGFGVPVVWTQHDLWAGTGGCHYPGECTGFHATCGSCPVLPAENRSPKDLSHKVWRTKKRFWDRVDLSLVSPSSWLAGQLRKSRLFDKRAIEVIPYGLNTGVFRPMPRAAARELLGLPPDRTLLLFGAVAATTDLRKGYAELCRALELLPANISGHCLAVVFGSETAPRIAIESRALGRFQDDLSLALIYSACDLFIVPSLEDNFPNTVLEAMSCGLPVAGFSAGGIGEAVLQGVNGWLVPVGNVVELSAQILRLVSDDAMRRDFGRRSRERAVREYPSGLQAERYRKIYAGILQK